MVLKALRNAYTGQGLNSLVSYPDFRNTTSARLNIAHPIRRIRVEIGRAWNRGLAHAPDGTNVDEDAFLRRPPVDWELWARQHLPAWYLYGAFFCSRGQFRLFQQDHVPAFEMPR